MSTVKIVVIGPESSGKTTLVKQLASHFKAPFVAEFARQYLEKRTTHVYEIADLENIARAQVSQTKLALSKTPSLLFCDTDLITLHIWALDKFDQSIPFVEENLRKEKADLYLLCAPDIVWEPDPLREDSNRRDMLFEWNSLALKSIDAKVEIISGQDDERTRKAILKVEEFLKSRSLI